MNTYYSQCGQDSIISEFFARKGIHKGNFLDVGASDGVRFSNTYLLEKLGWQGICVEMHPSYFDMLKENRPNSICYSCGVADADKTRQVVSLNWRASLSTTNLELETYYGADPRYYGDRSLSEINGFLNGRHEVDIRTLDGILEENRSKFPKIHFVSIDIDGSETRAFPHADLSKCAPDLLSLEHTVVGQHAVNSYAARFGFNYHMEIGSDILYVKTKEDNDLLGDCKVSGTQHHNRHPATGGD